MIDARGAQEAGSSRKSIACEAQRGVLVEVFLSALEPKPRFFGPTPALIVTFVQSQTHEAIPELLPQWLHDHNEFL